MESAGTLTEDDGFLILETCGTSDLAWRTPNDGVIADWVAGVVTVSDVEIGSYGTTASVGWWM